VVRGAVGPRRGGRAWRIRVVLCSSARTRSPASRMASIDLGMTPWRNDLAYSSSFITSVTMSLTTTGTQSGSPSWAIRTRSSMAATASSITNGLSMPAATLWWSASTSATGRWWDESDDREEAVEPACRLPAGLPTYLAAMEEMRLIWSWSHTFSRLRCCSSPRQRTSRRSWRWPGHHSWGRSRSPGLPCSSTRGLLFSARRS
jgi:hypothetical protein